MADDFIEGDKDSRAGHAPAMVEIFSETKGVDFDEEGASKLLLIRKAA